MLYRNAQTGMGMKPKRSIPDNMIQLQKALTELQAGKRKRYLFVTHTDAVHDQLDRAFHAIQSLGYPVLGSRALGKITLGKNDNVDGSGFQIQYIGLGDGDHLYQFLQGQRMQVVILEEANFHMLPADKYEILTAQIRAINSRYELQEG